MSNEEIGIACLSFTIQIYKNILFVLFSAFESESAFHIFAHHADTPFIILTCATCHVNKFTEVASSREGFREFCYGLTTCAFGHYINSARCRRCTAICTIVGHADTIDARIRPRSDIDTINIMRNRSIELIKETWYAVQHHMVPVHVDAAHGEVCIHRRCGAGTNRWIVHQHIRDWLGWIIKFLQRLLCHRHFGIRDIHNTLVSKNPQLSGFIDKTTWRSYYFSISICIYINRIQNGIRCSKRYPPRNC